MDQENEIKNSSETKKRREYPPLVKQKGGTYFYCGAIIGRKNIFVTEDYLEMMSNAFRMTEVRKDIKNLAYVIMPNFFYWMFRLPENQESPVDIYGEMKGEVAREIIRGLKDEIANGAKRMAPLFRFNERVGRSKPDSILHTFEDYAKRFKGERKYRVWAPKTEILHLDNDKAIKEKLEIIRRAPVSERWQLVDNPERYPYLYISDELVDSKMYMDLACAELPVVLPKNKSAVVKT